MTDTTSTSTTPAPTGLRGTEPARLYGYAATLLGVIGLVVHAIVSGDWSTALPLLAALIVAGPAATEATRASVYAPATVAGALSADVGHLVVDVGASDASVAAAVRRLGGTR